MRDVGGQREGEGCREGGGGGGGAGRGRGGTACLPFSLSGILAARPEPSSLKTPAVLKSLFVVTAVIPASGSDGDTTKLVRDTSDGTLDGEMSDVVLETSETVRRAASDLVRETAEVVPEALRLDCGESFETVRETAEVVREALRLDCGLPDIVARAVTEPVVREASEPVCEGGSGSAVVSASGDGDP